jgi:hypothetical protein
MAKPADFLFTELWALIPLIVPQFSLTCYRNQPFAPADCRTAKELTDTDTVYRLPGETAEPGFASLRRTLVKGWKDVDTLTRKPWQWLHC